MITMTTRKRNLDILLDLKSARYRCLHFHRENRYRRHTLSPSLAERLQRTLADLSSLFNTYRRRLRGNAFRRNHGRLNLNSRRAPWAREFSKS